MTKFLLGGPTIVPGTGTIVPSAGSCVPETPPARHATPTVRLSGYYLFIKRPIELGLALYMLVATLPLWFIVAVAVKIDSRGPVLFVHRRLGRHGVSFRFYKFRTMIVGSERRLADLRTYSEVDGPVFKMRNDPRVTRVGRLLRRSSIDELPQLINVLWGDMSLVGPRPPLAAEVERYTSSDWVRLAVKPGLTSLWAVNGRSRCSFEQWMSYDRYYVEKMSFALDLTILVQTVWVVLRGTGAY